MPKSLYRMYNEENDLLYVGVSWSPLTRFGRHGCQSVWFNEVATIKIERFPCEGSCREAESVAIQMEFPRYNKNKPKPISAEGRRLVSDSQKLSVVWIVSDDLKIREAIGNIRGNVVMVPSAHGPLYFSRPKWHDTMSEAENFIKGKS